MAEELKLKGLTGNTETNGGVRVDDIQASSGILSSLKSEKISETMEKKVNLNPLFQAVTSVCQNVSVDMQELDDQVNSMMEPGENMKHYRRNRKRAMICKVCGKEDRKENIREHIESVHITGISHPCNICGKKSRSTKGLKQHMAKEHH